MALQKLIGTDLDRIGQSVHKAPAYRVVLFDLYQDSLSAITLDLHEQNPLDVTEYLSSVQITTSHDTEANQASFVFAGPDFNWRWLLFSWVKVYEGDRRVDSDNWPCVFSGVFRGQPSRGYERDRGETVSHTAYDRSVLYRNRKHTSGRAWEPTDTDNDVGEICRQFALNSSWGMGLDPQEVLFNKLGYRIKKKLQIVDVDAMEALRKILQVVSKEPAFNGEGKLIVRDVDLDRLPIRVYNDQTLLKTINLPGIPANIPTSVTVRGLDYRVSRVDHRKQKIFTVGPITVGMFTPRVETRQSFDDNEEFRVAVDSAPVNVQFQGELLTHIFGLDDDYSITISQDGDFHCNIDIFFQGAVVAIAIVVGMLVAYILLKILGAEIGSSSPFTAFLGWVIEASATLMLLLILQTMRSLGKLQFEVHGEPFEYAYLELEGKARLSDVHSNEDQTVEIENHIFSTLTEVEDFAREELRRQVAQVAGRDLTISADSLLEPNDVLELDEEGEVARYYVLEVSKNIQRGSDPTYDISAHRAK